MKRFIIAALLLATATATVYATVPTTMSFQGVFKDGEGNIYPDSTYMIGFHIWAGPAGGPPIWTEFRDVDVTDGIFSIILGVNNPILPALFPKGGAWFSMSYDEEFLEPRQPLNSVGYAFRSCVCAHCDSLGNLTETSILTRFFSVNTRVDFVENTIDSILAEGAAECCDTLSDMVTEIEFQIEELWNEVGNLETYQITRLHQTNVADFTVVANNWVLYNSNLFQLNTYSVIHMYASTGLPVNPDPDWSGAQIYMNLINNTTGLIVHSSRRAGGYAPVSLHTETMSTAILPGTYYLQMRIDNLDNTENVTFDGWEMGALYQVTN